jgi:hypothetical protein
MTEPTSCELGEFFRGYVECALWSSTDQSTESGGYPLDDNYGPDDIDGATVLVARDECADFVRANYADLCAYVRVPNAFANWASAGHDFWLTRNRHGAGFWDRGLGELGDRLTEASHPYGEAYLMPGDGMGELFFS